MASSNGGIIGKTNAPTSTTASGVWSLSAAMLAIKDSNWPLDPFANPDLRLDFNETTTLDSRITFTRATSGTFFNSTGVLSTASSGVARFDHRLESGVWVNKGLLIEEQRANITIRSEEFGSADWTLTNATITANQITAPDGTTTADNLKENSSAGNHFLNATSFPSYTAGTDATISIFAKEFSTGSKRYLNLRALNSSFDGSFYAVFDLSAKTVTDTVSSGTGTYISSSITDVGNGWVRCTVTGKTSNGNALGLYVILNDTDAGIDSYTGDNTSGFHLWGAQTEIGSFATSYIKTTSASVTRNADQAVMTSTNFSSWYNQTEGTTFWQGDTFRKPDANANYLWTISDNSTNERLQNVFAFSSPNYDIRANVIDGGVAQLGPIIQNITFVENQTYKSGFAYKVNDFALSVDGATAGTDTSGTLPTVDRISLGSIITSGLAEGYINGHIAKFYYWNTRKPNSFLQSITG
jgi:hypothetical protein